MNSLAKLVLDTLPQIKRRGLTAEAVSYINTVDKIFRQGEEDLKAATKTFRATLPRAQRDSAEISPEVFIKTLVPTRRKLVRATDAFKAADSTPLEASASYTLAPKRLELAKKCLATGLTQGAGAGAWDEFDMVAMCFGDMNTHVQLGIAILSGNETKIDNAASMDTACRDGLDDKVWDFVRGGGLDNLQRVSKTSLRR